jgi:hypothetical protein
MCDYSLHSVASQPAKVGDRLVTTKFRGTMTRGFAALGEPNVAVCLRPGTELVFDTEIRIGFRWLPFQLGKATGKLARFRQLDMHRAPVHHDALEFANGATVLLTRLRPGQHATVLQLPAEPQQRADASVQAFASDSVSAY